MQTTPTPVLNASTAIKRGGPALGLLWATVFRHFWGFLALRGTSRRFTREV